MAIQTSGRVYKTRGCAFHVASTDGFVTVTRTAECFDPVTGAWSCLPPMQERFRWWDRDTTGVRKQWQMGKVESPSSFRISTSSSFDAQSSCLEAFQCCCRCSIGMTAVAKESLLSSDFWFFSCARALKIASSSHVEGSLQTPLDQRLFNHITWAASQMSSWWNKIIFRPSHLLHVRS